MRFYETQGTLPLRAPSYVERRADRELLQGLLRGDFCYVLTSRQMGKSSLMVRTAQGLREEGCTVVLLDLQAIGVNLTPEQWYDGLVVKMGRQLRMEDRLEDFWLDHERVGPVQRLFTALRDLVLPALVPEGESARTRLVVFIDEIDTVRSLQFPTDEFFAAIRECYNVRSSDPVFRSVTFALLGVATPAELMRDPAMTPFNIGRRVELSDFTWEEAQPLARGLGRPAPESTSLLQRVLRWTNGHPYLTQRLCQALASDPLLQHATDVDRLCEELFLSRRACDRDENLLFVRERLLRTGAHRAAVLRLYEQVHSRRNIPDDDANPLLNTLRLSGVVRVEHGLLAVRNRIYYHVFGKDWIGQNLEAVGEQETAAIAVLPFVDLSVEPSEYLSDGLTDELINALGQIPNLRVASRTSSFQFKGQVGDIRQIGNQLGVTIVLEGTLRRLGGRMRVTTQLVSVGDGHRIWSGHFKCAVEDIHRIQEEMAQAIVDQLRPELGQGSPLPVAVRSRPVNREAYHLYLKGRYHGNKRHEASLARSVEFFEEALRKDPEYAAALAGLADTHLIRGVYNHRPPAEAYPQARDAAIRALEIDDHLAEAHCALGCIHSVFDWDWVRAEKSFKRAIALNPSYATAHLWYGINCLTPLGRHDEALAELRLAQELDPLSIRVAASIGLALHFAGRNAEAVAQCRYTIELDEAFWLTHLFLGCAYLQESLIPEATHALQTAVDLSQGDAVALATLGYALAKAGREGEARRILSGLLELARIRYVPAGEIAALYSVLKEPDLTRQWLDKALQERCFRLVYLRVDPRLASLRSDQ